MDQITHREDCNSIIKKSLLIKKQSWGNLQSLLVSALEERNKYFKIRYSTTVHEPAGGSCTGGILLELTTNRTDLMDDGYEMFLCNNLVKVFMQPPQASTHSAE